MACPPHQRERHVDACGRSWTVGRNRDDRRRRSRPRRRPISPHSVRASVRPGRGGHCPMISPAIAVAGVGIGVSEAVPFYNAPTITASRPAAAGSCPCAVPPAEERKKGRPRASQRLVVPCWARGGRDAFRRSVSSPLIVALLPLVVVHGASQQELWSRVLRNVAALTALTGGRACSPPTVPSVQLMTTAAPSPAAWVFSRTRCAAQEASPDPVGAPALRIPGSFAGRRSRSLLPRSPGCCRDRSSCMATPSSRCPEPLSAACRSHRSARTTRSA